MDEWKKGRKKERKKRKEKKRNEREKDRVLMSGKEMFRRVPAGLISRSLKRGSVDLAGVGCGIPRCDSSPLLRRSDDVFPAPTTEVSLSSLADFVPLKWDR